MENPKYIRIREQADKETKCIPFLDGPADRDLESLLIASRASSLAGSTFELASKRCWSLILSFFSFSNKENFSNSDFSCPFFRSTNSAKLSSSFLNCSSLDFMIDFNACNSVVDFLFDSTACPHHSKRSGSSSSVSCRIREPRRCYRILEHDPLI